MVAGRPGPWYEGAATFLHAPMVDFDTLKPGMVAVSGAPHDSTHSTRFGTRTGPKGVREASLPLADKLRNAGKKGLVDVATGARLVMKDGVLADVGDANVYPTDVMKTTEGIAGLVYEVVKRGAFSVCLGGDHYVGYPSCLGATRAIVEKDPRVKVGYIHVDGHLDFTDGNPIFGRYNHGTNARRISELPMVSPSNMAWVGIQGWVSTEQWDLIHKNGAKIFTHKDLWELGAREVARRAADHAIQGCDYIYVSLDIDCIDTGFAPGTGGVVIGSVTPLMYLQIIEELAKYPILAFDLTEVTPRLDYTERTPRMAAEAVLRFIGRKVFEIH
ncbi:MAG: agmatinase family protein [Chloroflexi bacterium]|nr:agmatinase family protein [Chloroflexota bacterium]